MRPFRRALWLSACFMLVPAGNYAESQIPRRKSGKGDRSETQAEPSSPETEASLPGLDRIPPVRTRYCSEALRRSGREGRQRLGQSERPLVQRLADDGTLDGAQGGDGAQVVQR